MYHKTKRFISFFVLVGLMSVVPALASGEKVEKIRKPESNIISLPESKNLVAESKIVTGSSNHSYHLNIKKGETIKFKLKSLNATSLKVQSPSGVVKQMVDKRTHEGVLTGEGEFVFEISTRDASIYKLEVKRS